MPQHISHAGCGVDTQKGVVWDAAAAGVAATGHRGARQAEDRCGAQAFIAPGQTTVPLHVLTVTARALVSAAFWHLGLM